MVDLFLLLFLSLQGLTIYDIQYTTDPSGNSPYEGQVVTVQGVVTAGSNEWVRGLDGGFFIQEAPGPWHGIYVWAPSFNVKRSDSVEVTGTVQEYYGKTEISASSVTILAHRRMLPLPTVVTLDKISTGSDSAESYEGVLVRISRAWVVDPDLGYGEWLIGDQTGEARVDDAADYSYSPNTGDTLFLEGILDYSYSNFKLEPRGNCDLTLLSEYPIHAYFSRSVDTSLADSIEAHGNVRLDTLLVSFLTKAKSSIDFCFYSIASWNVVDTLIWQYNRGIRVRVIVENENHNQYTNALENAGIPLIDDAFGSNSGEYSMHNKFAIIDVYDSTTKADDWLWTGSFNASYNSALYNDNNVITVRDSLFARAYTLEFEEMWGSSNETPDPTYSRFGNNKTNNTPHIFAIGGDSLSLYFSPTDLTLAHLTNVILSAHRSIYFGIYGFTHQDISDAMKSRWDSGSVMVSGVFDSLFWLDPSGEGESWDLSGQGGGNPWSPPAYVCADAIPDGVLHSKVLLVDADRPDLGGKIVTGSMNWTYSGVNHNDENMVIIKSPIIANQYLQDFAARWEETGRGYPPGEFPIYTLQYERNSSDSSLYVGKRVITSGVVTGIFGNRFFIENMPGAPWNGIFVDAGTLAIELGDSARVMGILEEDDLMTGISEENGGYVEDEGSIGLPETLAISIPDFAESLECILVGTGNAEFVETGTFSQGLYHIVNGTDTGLIFIDPESDIPGTTIPEGSVNLVGILEQIGGIYALTPRFLEDISTACICGDINDDGNVSYGDATYLASYLYSSGPPPPHPECANVNGDSQVDTGDLIYLTNYLFAGGPPPNCF